VYFQHLFEDDQKTPKLTTAKGGNVAEVPIHLAMGKRNEIEFPFYHVYHPVCVRRKVEFSIYFCLSVSQSLISLSVHQAGWKREFSDTSFETGKPCRCSTECFSLHQGERLKHSVETLARFCNLKVDIRTLFSVHAGANWEAKRRSGIFPHALMNISKPKEWNMCDRCAQGMRLQQVTEFQLSIKKHFWLPR